MARRYTESELEGFLEEALAPEEMAAIETALRKQPRLRKTLAALNARRDAGVHSLGAIWRRRRISCPTREQLGSYLLGALRDEYARYIEFHLEKIGCRFCRANLEDLKRRQTENSEAAVTRRRKYFQSSAGYLSGEE